MVTIKPVLTPTLQNNRRTRIQSEGVRWIIKETTILADRRNMDHVPIVYNTVYTRLLLRTVISRILIYEINAIILNGILDRPSISAVICVPFLRRMVHTFVPYIGNTGTSSKMPLSPLRPSFTVLSSKTPSSRIRIFIVENIFSRNQPEKEIWLS